MKFDIDEDAFSEDEFKCLTDGIARLLAYFCDYDRCISCLPVAMAGVRFIGITSAALST